MFKKFVSPAVVALTALACNPASAAFEDFCVNSLALGGTSSTANYSSLISSSDGCTASSVAGFTADKLNGGYRELLVVTPTSTAGVFNFQSTVFVTWGQYFRDDGGTSIGGVETLLGNQYGLYSVVRASGTLSGGSFSASSASLELWADQFSETGGALTRRTGWDAGLNPVLTGDADDDLLMTGTFLGGSGAASAPGIFAFQFQNIALTTLGNDYFIAPRPFYFKLQSDGDVDTNGFNVTGPGRFELVGDVSANFFIPEPGSLALAGLALLGLGLATRRKA